VVLKPARVKISGKQISISDKVYFDSGRSTIKKSSFSLLDEVADLLIAHPELLEIRIEGHTDSRGGDDTNQRLSEARAKSVRTYLTNKKISAKRLTSIGHGEAKPLDDRQVAEAWAKNRRVEFHIEKVAEFQDEIPGK
jgi:outer membrane protein OmpA-like peptidoglycan-associated protein